MPWSDSKGAVSIHQRFKAVTFALEVVDILWALTHNKMCEKIILLVRSIIYGKGMTGEWMNETMLIKY